MQVVTNADDFGASTETVAATVACFEQGALTSATIMTAMPETAAALAFAAAHPEYGFGVHLQLVGDGTERPISAPADVPGLVDVGGALLPTGVVRKRALLGRLSVDELRREIEAQIDVARSFGLELTHVDSHRHLHKLGPVREALRQALPRFGLHRVRRVQDVFLRRPLAAPTYWLGRWWQRDLGRSFTTTNRFYMPSSAHDVGWDTALLDRLDRLGAGTIEVGVHPGTTEDWRADEGACIVRFSRGARERGHTLVSWAAIPDG